MSGARTCVHRKRHVARPREQLHEVLTDDLILGEPGGAEPLGVRADDAAVGSEQAKADLDFLEQEVDECVCWRCDLSRHADPQAGAAP